MHCPRCHKDLPSDASFCLACGASLDNDATRKIEYPKWAGKSSRSFESIDNARFVPGTILAERYRIVGLLGKGGMGEVYRADDLTLSQPVALKFLPQRYLTDGAALSRFHREVRVARQVSHRNVCRVYDIGEIDGHHFLSMEYIKGEELSSLLRRIGRLPSDKALQIARQLCAGLAAAHESGILHRDLKPSNVMIDGDGNARILDFGLSGLTDEFRDDEIVAGTPAYMAPEQFEGKAVTARSDIYSLGLVLYELFTGKRAYDASTLGELMKLRRSDTTPTTPTSIVKDLDPVIERVIERCMEKDAAKRPVSALQIAAALPGGDPIAAALAAGETPSPEMVAASTKEGVLRPAVAVSLLAGVIVGLTLISIFAGKVVVHGFVPLSKSPDVLQQTARDIIQMAGVSAPEMDSMHWFDVTRSPLNYIAANDRRYNRWQSLTDGQPAVVFYSYRQSPSYLEGFDPFRDPWHVPEATLAGMNGVKLDTRGRLLEFYAVPPQIDPVPIETKPTSEQDAELEKQLWSPFFNAAGFDPGKFTRTPSQWAPRYVNDSRIAWEGSYPEQPEIPVRVEAASYRGKPVHFVIVNPWDTPERQNPAPIAAQFRAIFVVLICVFVLLLIGGVLLAIRNLKLGRGDRKGALRVAVFMFTLTAISRVASAHHVPSLGEFGTLLNGLQDALFAGVFLWIVYVAVEPLTRRRWPHRIVSWTRLLAGDFRDPLVGRDVLIGGAAGAAIGVWQIGSFFIRSWLGDPNLKPFVEPAVTNLGMLTFVPALSDLFTTPLLNASLWFFLTLLLALVLRNDLLGFLGGAIVFTAVLALLGGGTAYTWIGAAIGVATLTFVLYRYGLLAAMVAIFYLHLYIFFPVTTRFTAWHAPGFVVALVLLIAVTLYAFRISVAGQPVFSGALLQED